jgi:hypothetical protein
MNLPPIGAYPTPVDLAQPKAGDQQKLAECCRQFEAVLWRQLLEKSNASGVTGAKSAGDPAGVYQYMLSDTISQAVAGGPKSFAKILEAQLTRPAHGQGNTTGVRP